MLLISKPKFWILGFLLLAIDGLFLESATALSLSSSGHLSQQLETSAMDTNLVKTLSERYGVALFRKEWSWNLVVEGSRWRMRIEPKGEGEGVFELGCDGGVTYSVKFTGSAAKEVGQRAIARVNDSIAVIEHGVMPYEGFLPAHPIWLSMCAPQLLSDFSNGKMPALDTIGGAESPEGRSAQFKFDYELLSPSQQFFSKFEMRDDGFMRSKLDDGRFVISEREPPYNHGFVRLRLITLETGKFGGFEYPLRSSFQRLVPKADGDSTVRPIDTWSIEILSFNSPAFSKVEIPSPTGATDVKDRRFATAKPPVFEIEYRLAAKRWMSDEEPFVRSRYEAAALVEGKHLPQSQHRRYLVIALLAAVFGASGLMLFKMCRSKTSKP